MIKITGEYIFQASKILNIRSKFGCRRKSMLVFCDCNNGPSIIFRSEFWATPSFTIRGNPQYYLGNIPWNGAEIWNIEFLVAWQVLFLQYYLRLQSWIFSLCSFSWFSSSKGHGANNLNWPLILLRIVFGSDSNGCM